MDSDELFAAIKSIPNAALQATETGWKVVDNGEYDEIIIGEGATPQEAVANARKRLVVTCPIPLHPAPWKVREVSKTYWQVLDANKEAVCVCEKQVSAQLIVLMSCGDVHWDRQSS